MRKFWIIVKFTLKELLTRSTFYITNIIMMCVIIFLVSTVLKIGKITDKFMNSNVNVEISRISQDVGGEDAIDIQYPNTEVEVSQANINQSMNNVFNGGFIMAFILFFSIYFYGYLVSNSISSEKTSRVLETLIVSTRPEAIVLGKTFAMGIVGVFQMLFLLLVAGITLAIKEHEHLNIFFEKIGFIRFSSVEVNMNFFEFEFGTFEISVMFVIPILIFVYFVFGYMVYAFICALVGAGINKAEDIQLVNGPISILAMICFYLSVFTNAMPNSNMKIFVRYFPFASPFAMPIAILAGDINIFEILVSLTILLFTGIWLAKMSIKLYKHVIFNYGNRTYFKDVLRILFFENHK